MKRELENLLVSEQTVSSMCKELVQFLSIARCVVKAKHADRTYMMSTTDKLHKSSDLMCDPQKYGEGWKLLWKFQKPPIIHNAQQLSTAVGQPSDGCPTTFEKTGRRSACPDL